MPITQYCDGFNTEMFSGEELDSLNCPHYVYFAYFGPGLMKVGVSAQSRGWLRQIEQGSHYALIIAEELSGVPARQLETLFRKSGMQDKSNLLRKKIFCFLRFLQKKGKRASRRFQTFLPQVFALRPDFEELVKKKSQNFMIFLPSTIFPKRKKWKTISRCRSFIGRIGVGNAYCGKGSFSSPETDSEKVLVDAKRLKGYSVDFSAKPLGLQKRASVSGIAFLIRDSFLGVLYLRTGDCKMYENPEILLNFLREYHERSMRRIPKMRKTTKSENLNHPPPKTGPTIFPAFSTSIIYGGCIGIDLFWCFSIARNSFIFSALCAFALLSWQTNIQMKFQTLRREEEKG